MTRTFGLIGITLLLFFSCGLATTRPKLEMSMAASAFLAAKEVKANILAPNLYRKAEILYLKAKSSYRRKYFNKAKQYAILSQKYSERAEFIAVRKATLENIEIPTEPAANPDAEPGPAPASAEAEPPPSAEKE